MLSIRIALMRKISNSHRVMMVQGLPDYSNVNFLAVDDHELILKATVSELQKRFPKANVLTANNAEAAYKKVKRHAPVLLLLDLSIPFAEGVMP